MVRYHRIQRDGQSGCNSFIKKKISEELSILREKEKKRREQEWPPEPPKWLKFMGGIGYICIGFRSIGWLQKVDWEKKLCRL
ncbi:hypothetical protein D6C82_10571 [Aureobasidium pullulans]|nr:hypothetical protein D6C82_10571 [Aureobasidium pullulans]